MKRDRVHRLQVYRAQEGVVAWRCACGNLQLVGDDHQNARRRFREHIVATEAAGIVQAE